MFSLMIIDKTGTQKEKLLPVNEYLQIVAASNFKQRTRMSMLYYHAEALHYAVVGTPNKHEQEQGFFVKYGDGAGDVMPIGNLYKTQVYQLAEYLGVPKAIIRQNPNNRYIFSRADPGGILLSAPVHPDGQVLVWF